MIGVLFLETLLALALSFWNYSFTPRAAVIGGSYSSNPDLIGKVLYEKTKKRSKKLERFLKLYQ